MQVIRMKSARITAVKITIINKNLRGCDGDCEKDT